MHDALSSPGSSTGPNPNPSPSSSSSPSPDPSAPHGTTGAAQRLVLLGAGAAHLHVLRAWARQPLPGCALVLVAPQSLAAHAGMVPGWLAGDHRFSDLCIDAAALARAAGATWLATEAVSLDAAARRLTLADGQVLDYDLLSLNGGAGLQAPPAPPAPPHGRVLSLRPGPGLQAAWDELLQNPWLLDDDAPLAVTAVGAGAGGVQSLLAVCARLRRQLPRRTLLPHLVGRSQRLLPGMAPGLADRAGRALQAAGVQLSLGVDAQRLMHRPAAHPGLLLWATGAQALGWLQGSGLALDARGCVRVDAQLRSVSHPQVLATSDGVASDPAWPRSGAQALHQGPVLLHNLRAALQGRPLRPYAPPRRHLALLALGNRRALGAWGDWSAEGAWLWRWKNLIDRRYIAGFRQG